ncbi:hypothetical protein BGAL_0262g00090 [Botrytis galanthina]|uniref:Uncharacterized protein n=1 Tax=Botrytis galanthina TaxID=278940 RepID=A0A4V4HU61_9HELO|nr:hypothetical protein BGAL_0262g00090 [Botrytis galanthina]
MADTDTKESVSHRRSIQKRPPGLQKTKLRMTVRWTIKDAARTNERGIPYAPFVDRVEDYVTTRADVEPTLKRFQEMIS